FESLAAHLFALAEVTPMASPESTPLRIIVFSTLPAEGVVAVLTLFKQLGHEVPLIVTTPGPTTRRQHTYADIVAALPTGQDILISNHMNRLAPMLAPLRPDPIFTASFPWRLPAELLTLPRLGAVNAHPALLPRHRGPNPLFWTVINGDTQAGLTFHRMAPDFDTGPILAQSAIEVTPEDDVDTLLARITAAAAALFPRVLQAVASGDPGVPQREENASYARVCTEEDRWLDWTRPATQLHNHVRAWGRSGAWATLEGQRIVARRARVEDAPAGEGSPGSVLSRSPEGVAVRSGSGALVLTDYGPFVEPETGE
ncbi:MAG: methionyl-tRNA formyltransferase, partial [Ktedonobacterales bacterium]